MGKFDKSIEWLEKRQADAKEAISDLLTGKKIELNGKDVTQQWMSKYQHIIAQCEQLISAYKSRND